MPDQNKEHQLTLQAELRNRQAKDYQLQRESFNSHASKNILGDKYVSHKIDRNKRQLTFYFKKDKILTVSYHNNKFSVNCQNMNGEEFSRVAAKSFSLFYRTLDAKNVNVFVLANNPRIKSLVENELRAQGFNVVQQSFALKNKLTTPVPKPGAKRKPEESHHTPTPFSTEPDPHRH